MVILIKNSVYEFSKKNLSNFKIFNSPEDISIYLKNLKFVITAGGTSVYEFASARIPQLVVILEKHQKRMAKAVEQNSFGKILIRNDKKIEKNLLKTLKNFYDEECNLLEFSRNTKKIIKRSGCEFIVNDILKLCNSKT